ncbi:MAG: hypothetical protein ACLPWF_04735 [Bryobacteraceae bacterium]
MTKKGTVNIKGISPLLMCSFPLVPVPHMDKLSMSEQAEAVTYRDPGTGLLCIPAVNIQRALVAGAAYSHGKGRASLQKPTSACVLVGPEHVDLGRRDYALDSRPVRIPATGGRIVRHRPRLDEWECSFTVEFDSELLSEEQLRTIVDDTGSRIGILDFRPEKKGMFGRFMVTGWSF